MAIELLKIKEHRVVFNTISDFGEGGATMFEVCKALEGRNINLSFSTIGAKIREQKNRGYIKEGEYTSDRSRKGVGSASVLTYVVNPHRVQ